MHIHTRRSLTALSLLSFGVALGCGASKDTSGENNCLPSDPNCNDGGQGFDVSGLDIGGGDGFVVQDISIDPSNATIYIDTATTPPTPASQTYTAKLNLPGGGQKDVTGEVLLTLDDPSLGNFKGNVFTSVSSLPGVKAGAVGGVTTIVHGNAEGKSGTAALTIVQLRKTGDHRDFYFEVPYLSPPTPDRDVLKFGTNIKQVDVAISMDTTGSMGGSIANLKSGITTTLFPGLVAAIPSVGLAVAYHDDYPTGSYGNAGCGTVLPGDVPSGIVQVVTTDLPTATTAANKLETHCGGDGPEAQEPSMHHILTGKELKWDTGSVPAHTPAPGTFGGVDFRPGSLPVVVEITDITWHDATTPTGAAAPYGTDVTSPPSITDVINDFNSNNARFIDITNGAYISFEPQLEDQANQVSDATKSNIPPSAFAAGGTDCPTGMSGAGRPPTGPAGTCRLNFLHNNGAGVSDSIVKAIQAVSVGSTFDVTAQPSNDPTNAPGTDGKPVDATKFIKALRAMDEGSPKDGCPAHAAKDTDGDGIKDTFLTVVVGTAVCFEVLPQENTTVPPKPQVQFFNAFIDVLGMPGSVKLDRRIVLFEVPPKDPTAK
jgi:hypothetical protein